jgi:hypothetical protein
MTWVPVPGYTADMNVSDAPRPLTKAEIDYIVSHVPLSPAGDPIAANLARAGVVRWMEKNLREVKLVPSAIPELVKRIVQQHTKSLVVPGTPVGTTAGEAVGATTTQMTLNSFHMSGSSKSASFGIDAMRDIIFASQNPKNVSSTIYYLNKTMSYEQVLDTRSFIVGSVVMDFVKDYDISTPDQLEKFWWHDAVAQMTNKTIPDSDQVLRLTLDTVQMYKFRVTIGQLARAIESELKSGVMAVYGSISDGMIDLYPIREAVAEKLIEKKINSIPAELAQIVFLETIIMPALQTLRVKGVAGIKNLTPIVTPVWRTVLNEQRVSEQIRTENPNLAAVTNNPDLAYWFLFYNSNFMFSTGLTVGNLNALCGLAGVIGVAQFPKIDSDRLVVSVPADRFRAEDGSVVIQRNGKKYLSVPSSSTMTRDGVLYKEVQDEPKGQFIQIDSKYYVPIAATIVDPGSSVVLEEVSNQKIRELGPGEYVKLKIMADKNTRKEAIACATEEIREKAKTLPEAEAKVYLKRTVIVPRSKLVIASEFVIAETDGDNLRELMTLPGIDKSRTTCSNMNVVASTLGIEAARTHIIRALTATIANSGSYVNPAHIMLIAEFITSRGSPYGATYTGISRQPAGHLSMATIEKAGKVFMQSALHGLKEDIRNVSASISVGERMAIGDGAFDVAQDITENGVKRTIINSDLFTQVLTDDKTRERMAEVYRKTQENSDDAIKNLPTVDTGFDASDGKDDPHDMLHAFDKEIVPDLVRGVGIAPGKQEQRKQAGAAPAPDIPRDLVDVLNTIEVGIPNDGPKLGPIRMGPIRIGAAGAAGAAGVGGPAGPSVAPPTLTRGIAREEEEKLSPQAAMTMESDLLKSLNEMLQEDFEASIPPQMKIVEEMPSKPIPELPSLDDFDPDNFVPNEAPEFKPVDLTALQQALQGKK